MTINTNGSEFKMYKANNDRVNVLVDVYEMLITYDPDKIPMPVPSPTHPENVDVRLDELRYVYMGLHQERCKGKMNPGVHNALRMIRLIRSVLCRRKNDRRNKKAHQAVKGAAQTID